MSRSPTSPSSGRCFGSAARPLAWNILRHGQFPQLAGYIMDISWIIIVYLPMRLPMLTCTWRQRYVFGLWWEVPGGDGKILKAHRTRESVQENDAHLHPHMRLKKNVQILHMLRMHRHTHTVLGVNVVKPIIDNPKLNTNGYKWIERIYSPNWRFIVGLHNQTLQWTIHHYG